MRTQGKKAGNNPDAYIHNMKTTAPVLLVLALAGCVQPNPGGPSVNRGLTMKQLHDKIKGGWAGQVIGVTYGGPTEFRFQGSMINDYQPIAWYDGYIKETMTGSPGLYDDLYMDLTFVEVFEKFGLDAPAAEHAKAYANAGYRLWHANQSGRYNILNGIGPPASGHWHHNPHAEDIDFQIEADFSGLMAPGMPNTAAAIGDSIGHIMNYGDGWYGGVYVGAMYSLAFISNDVRYVVTEALKTIPSQSTFHQCITDVIAWHDKYPDDWKQTWLEIQKKWADDVGCPDGVFDAFNIDAKVNAAYIVLGMLYGNGDYGKTLEITARAGQDSDCNPSSAGGILGTMMGYSAIPEYWKQGLAEAEDIDFKYTTMSLNDAYALSLKHAQEVIRKNGGRIDGESVVLPEQAPSPVRLEQAFPGLVPAEKKRVSVNVAKEHEITFSGTGFVLRGESRPNAMTNWDYEGDFAFDAEMYLDGQLAEKVRLPANHIFRRNEIFWKYSLPEGNHTVKVKLLNPHPDFRLELWDMIVYQSTNTNP
jgi:hypothetical protein